MPWNPSLFSPPPRCTPSRRPFLMVENRDSILTSHRTTLSGHRMRRKEKPHQFLHRGLTAKFVLTDAGLVTMDSPVCEASLNSRLVGPLPAFCPRVFPPYDKLHKRQRQRKIVTIFGRKRIDKNQEYSLPTLFLTRVAIRK